MKRKLFDLFKKNKALPMVSVVIPMYNCEDFVKELLEGLLQQSFKNFEVICVIDGASDSTEKYVKYFCKKDSRIQMITQAHSGAGAARNKGLDKARGQYIMWLDADDLYSSDLLENLVQAADTTNADIAMCLAKIKDYSSGNVKENHGFNTKVFQNGKAIKPKNPLVLRRSIDVGIQYKLFKTDFVRNNKLRFSHTRIANDWFFDHATRIAAERIVGIHKCLVEYRKFINPESITTNRHLYLNDYIDVSRELWRWLKQNRYLPEYEEYFCNAFDGGLSYNIRFKKTNDFEQKIVKTINEDEPWSKMDDVTLLNKLRNSIGGMERFRKNYEDSIQNLNRENLYLNNYDNKADISKAMECTNALSIIRSVREISDKKYGRAVLKIPKVSVIIPVYNGEQYLDKCIKSLENQTLKDLEFIFVDDCSKDNSLKMIEDFAKNDSRVQILRNKNNLGAGASRNNGINIALGEYLAFMDSDDYVDYDFYDKLYHIAIENDKDIAKGVRKKVNIDGEFLKDQSSSLNKKIQEKMTEGNPLYIEFSSEHQTAIFKHCLFDDGEARYGLGNKAEDVLFLYIICNKTNNIIFDDSAIYYYVQNENGIIRDSYYSTHQDGIFAIKDTIDWINKKRNMNKYDCFYVAGKLNKRHKEYVETMNDVPQLKEQYDKFVNDIIDIINYSGVPDLIINQNKRLKKLYESHYLK